MRIEVHKCRWTGKLFELTDRKKYAAHLIKLRAELKQKRYHAKLRKNFTRWLRKEKLKLTHTSMIIPWIMANQEQLMASYDAMHPGESNFGNSLIETLSFDNEMRYQELLSNSHSCPYNGVQNWGRKEGKPLGYPGWSTYVRCKFKVQAKNCASFSDFCDFIGIRTGSGGGSYNSFGYNASLFLADWPGLEVQVFNASCDKITDILKGQ